MNKVLFCSLFSIMTIILFAQSAPLEARHHCRGSRVQVGLGANVVARDTYVTRRYMGPVAARPVIVTQDPYYYYSPAPVYAYAPAYVAPVYVEEVQVVQRSRPLSFGGLSFFFNL